MKKLTNSELLKYRECNEKIRQLEETLSGIYEFRECVLQKTPKSHLIEILELIIASIKNEIRTYKTIVTPWSESIIYTLNLIKDDLSRKAAFLYYTKGETWLEIKKILKVPHTMSGLRRRVANDMNRYIYGEDKSIEKSFSEKLIYIHNINHDLQEGYQTIETINAFLKQEHSEGFDDYTLKNIKLELESIKETVSNLEQYSIKEKGYIEEKISQISDITAKTAAFLYYLGGMQWQEIAAIMRYPTGRNNISSRVRRYLEGIGS